MHSLTPTHSHIHVFTIHSHPYTFTHSHTFTHINAHSVSHVYTFTYSHAHTHIHTHAHSHPHSHPHTCRGDREGTGTPHAVCACTCRRGVTPRQGQGTGKLLQDSEAEAGDWAGTDTRLSPIHHPWNGTAGHGPFTAWQLNSFARGSGWPHLSPLRPPFTVDGPVFYPETPQVPGT